MILKSEKEIMEMDKLERSNYLKALHNFVRENGGSIPTEVFPDFIMKKEAVNGFDCPKCGIFEIDSIALINTTDHTDDSWVEHCICKNCGTHFKLKSGI